MSSRRKARVWALKLLFQLEFGPDETVDEATRAFWEQNFDGDEAARAYAEALVAKVRARKDAIDSMLREAATNWVLERVGAPERNLLRIAVAEIFYTDDVPPKVAINEAIEVAKVYGSGDRAPQFVNGVLDAVYRRHTAAA